MSPSQLRGGAREPFVEVVHGVNREERTAELSIRLVPARKHDVAVERVEVQADLVAESALAGVRVRFPDRALVLAREGFEERIVEDKTEVGTSLGAERQPPDLEIRQAHGGMLSG